MAMRQWQSTSPPSLRGGGTKRQILSTRVDTAVVSGSLTPQIGGLARYLENTG